MIKWSLLLFSVKSRYYLHRESFSFSFHTFLMKLYVLQKLWESVNESANNISFVFHCYASQSEKTRDTSNDDDTRVCLKAGSRAWTKKYKMWSSSLIAMCEWNDKESDNNIRKLTSIASACFVSFHSLRWCDSKRFCFICFRVHALENLYIHFVGWGQRARKCVKCKPKHRQRRQRRRKRKLGHFCFCFIA